MATGAQVAAAAPAAQLQGAKPQTLDAQQASQPQQQQDSRQQEHNQQQHQPPQQHGRMYDVSYKAMNRALLVEQEALQKIHMRIQKQLQHLEAEEKIIEHMIKRQQQAPDEQPPAHR